MKRMIFSSRIHWTASILALLVCCWFPATPVFSQELSDWQPLLDQHFSAQEQTSAATAATATYLTEKEQQVVAYTNLARLYPQQFAAFYRAALQADEDEEGWEKFESGDTYYATLYTDLLKMKPLPSLTPTKKLWRAAAFWAKYSGKRGIEGHNRPWCPWKFDAECCDYNPAGEPMTMVLDLLVDEGVRSLGHRRILLGKYTFVGASIQPHTDYDWCLVMDFGTGKK
jgi:uncharacterized protein YkwD